MINITGVCDPNPCQNGGTCNIGDDGAPICTCKTDTSGTNCEQSKESIQFTQIIKCFLPHRFHISNHRINFNFHEPGCGSSVGHRFTIIGLLGLKAVMSKIKTL